MKIEKVSFGPLNKKNVAHASFKALKADFSSDFTIHWAPYWLRL